MEEERKYYILGRNRSLDLPEKDQTQGTWIQLPNNVDTFCKHTLSEMIKQRDSIRKRSRTKSGRNYEIYELKLIETKDES